ncbi:MAG: non-canonical purine NTP pyrophosphatase [Candidatus Saccharibacteria bacterium]
MKILIATHNQSKLKRYQQILKSIDFIELVSLTDLNITEKVEEDCATNTDNALKKAHVYGKLSGLITVAADEALMTNFLPDNEQPGVYARRFTSDRSELTDNGVIDAWKQIFKLFPQDDKQFIWSFAIAFYNPTDESEDISHVQQISYVADHFSNILPSGYPMSTFMSPYPNGKPYSELTIDEDTAVDAKNFANFTVSFTKWLDEKNK